MNRGLGMLGLCARAGKLQSGGGACDQLIKRGEALLVLVDGGASVQTQKAVHDACAYYDVPMRRLPEGLLGEAIGRPGRMVAAITDRTFAERLNQLIPQSENFDR